ncbi:hypothetical protein VTL71DRAFT_6830 [Oculimacula yallundae]|uniref:Uncharacterized protein n=1 Tax=Oculimacula yallundae TaxID=86028 RepID=A0ABR4BY14_9HELO
MPKAKQIDWKINVLTAS